MSAPAAAIARPKPPSREELQRWSSALEGKNPDEIIRFAWEHFAPELAVATQFGVDGCTLLHRVSRIAPMAHFFTIDTELLFAETYALADELEKKLGIRIARIRPAESVGAQAAQHGPNLWETDPDLCCTLRKVQPMTEYLSSKRAWITAIRREQSSTRREAPIVDWDQKFGLVKIAPLVDQTQEQIDTYVVQHGVPTNPLRKLGYASLGCMTCTRPLKEGESGRDGRWWRTQKTECGLHTKP